MVEILYAEASELLARIILSEFDEYEIMIVKTKDRLLNEIYKSAPLLVIIGDSFSIDLEEIIFTLKSLETINEIPVIFIGEHYRSSMLPVDMVIPRDGSISQKVKIDISRLMYEKRKDNLQGRLKHLEKPAGLLKKDFIQETSKALILDRLYDAYFETELGCLDVTESSLETVIRNILKRISRVLNTDFSFISVSSGETRYEIMHIENPVNSSPNQDIETLCRNGIKNGEIVSPELKDSVTLFTVLDSPDIGIYGYYVTGCNDHRQNRLEPAEAENISSQIKKQIYLAGEFGKKETDTAIIYSAFSRFLPEEIINDLLIKDTEKDLMTGEKRSIVALFSHIRNFDYIMAENSPDNVVNFLNQHFTNMVSIIKKYGGSVDKFIGDAVYAIFGAPVSYIDNADRAARAAIEMIREYDKIDIRGLKMPEAGFTIGVGLNEGPAIIGNIGCSDKFDYTSIGDTINLAARLESLTKHYKTPILISERLKDNIDQDFTARLVDIARVKGKTEPTKIYSLEIKPEIFSDEWTRLYENGIKMYRIGNWYTATGYFEKAVQILPDDFPSMQFLDRCRQFQETPPETWDGATTLDFK